MVKVADSRDFVANYELNQYSYSGFWIGREYEHLAEVNLLQTLFSKYLTNAVERSLVDLGGAYGRHLPVYGNLVREVVLADYSTRELLDGKKNIDHSSFAGRVSYIALNAYRLPFKQNTVDSLLSVRVVHHLKDLPIFLSELERVLVPGGIAVVEFANKNHILALIKRWFRLNFSYFAEPIYKVEHQLESSQGMKEGQVAIMYNFSPKFVKDTAMSVGLKVKTMVGCSFLRSRVLKKLFPRSLLLFKENILQKLFGWLLITPSVFIVLEKSGSLLPNPGRLLDRQNLQCPTCGHELGLEGAVYACAQGHVFPQRVAGVVDLRDPRPETIDF